MNDIIYQIGERIHDLNSPENESLVKNMLLLEIETYCRIALALAIDEVTRPDNYLCIADKAALDDCRDQIREYFRFGTPTYTLGKQLDFADRLLSVFRYNGCPEHIMWIRKLIEKINADLQLRNVDAHQLPIARTVPALMSNLIDLQGNADGNPYLDEDKTSILVLRPDLIRRVGYAAEVMNFHRYYRDISVGELLRLSPGEDENQAMSGPNASITAPIALHSNAVYLHVVFPDGIERLHLLSPLLAHFSGREYGIYYKRQNSVFRTSLYISLNSRITQEQIPTWNEHQQLLFDRAEQLKSIVWGGPLFEDEDRSNLKHSMKIFQSTDGSNHMYYLNVRRDKMHSTYPELWHAVWGDNQNTLTPSFFNVDVYDNVTLAPLHRMFRSDLPPIANPLQVCGQGGVGKTHTVINALFRQFVNARVIDAHCLKFKYVIFLTAKRTMFNFDNVNTTYTQWENPDFQSCNDALWKILRIITDGRPTNAAQQADDQEFDESVPLTVREIRNRLGSDPMLLIIDDLDSVRSTNTMLDGEAKRLADKEEQRDLVKALNRLAENNDNCRIIITTRRPLDETSMLQLMPLAPDVALNFASAYYRRYRPTEMIPEAYKEAIAKIGNGVPAFIMRIVFLLNRATSYSLDSAQMQKLRRDIADFSLNTTSLGSVGRKLFSILAQMSNALDALPVGLLKILLYNEDLDSINDAIDDMRNWSMIEDRGHSERIALQNDSLILWSQLEEYATIDAQQQKILNAVRQDNDRWLSDYSVHPGVLMDKVFSALESELSIEEKKSFAQRIKKLLESREMFFQGMQNDPRQRKIVDMWISLFLGEKDQTVKEAAPIPAHTPQVTMNDGDGVEQLIEEIQQGTWNSEKISRLLDHVRSLDLSEANNQSLFKEIIQFLPRLLLEAVKGDRCSASDGDEFVGVLDSICTRYDEYTGEHSSENYLEPFVQW